LKIAARAIRQLGRENIFLAGNPIRAHARTQIGAACRARRGS
jgi:hypothetical protein